MNRRHKETNGLSDPVTKMATELAQVMGERSRLNKELLIALAEALSENEKRQRKFRNAVLIRLSRIEIMVQMIHGGQIAEAHLSEPCSKEKMTEHAKAADEFISQKSNELGLKMVKYIYGESEEPEDALFAILEAEPNEPKLLDFGIAFYQRLESQSDASLSAGNLPRNEVNAGLAELKRRKVGLMQS